MNAEELAIRQRLKDDFAHYASKCLKIRTKAGKVEPFLLNEAQRYIHERVEEQPAKNGKVRAIILKGRQQGCCYSPDMRVLTADYRWLRIGDVEVGQRLIATDENTGEINGAGRRTERRVRTAVVEAKVCFRHEAFEVTLDSGVKLVVTGEHRHLCRKRGGDDANWRTVADTRPGDYIRAFAHAPDDAPPSFEDGWMAGLMDGEGSFSASPAVRIAISQVDGPVLQRAKKYLSDRGINYYELIDHRVSCGQRNKLGDKPVHCLRIDRHTDILKLMTLTRPSRFVTRELFVGKKMPKTAPGFNAWARVVSIKSVGVRDVVDIQTSEKTFICEGLVSHNSTYVEGRFYWRVSHTRGVRAFILTHDEEATNNLFELANRYHQNCPAPVKPSTSAANAKELHFDKLDSGYKVGTAGNKAVGRSSTVQLFHGSEVGFWPNAQQHAAGILQAIPDAPGTEAFLESTANGIGNFYHQQWQAAEAGLSDYIAIFVPWYWQPEYQKTVPDDFSLTEEENQYRDAYNLTLEQMAWRRSKIVELKDPVLFKQEYPATAAEAFQVSGQDPYITAELVLNARKAQADEYGPKLLGVDPARFGDDRTSICFRQGRKVHWIRSYTKKSTMEVVGLVKMAIEEIGADQCAVDIGGLGAGVYDRLLEVVDKSQCKVVSVNSGSVPLDAQKYTNKRAEMWGEIKLWLAAQPAQIPDSDELQADLTQIKYSYDSNSALKMERKEDMKKRGFRSPDMADALGLTFAEPFLVATKKVRPLGMGTRSTGWMGS